jgi:glycosyltransferase involved in cell wall biosynthesis
MPNNILSEIIIITSYPPRECGIATYSQDLVKSIENKFKQSFNLRICALETETENHAYPKEVEYVLNTADKQSYADLSHSINYNIYAKLVLIQHEFGFFNTHEEDFLNLVHTITIPAIITFHTVLPNPNDKLKKHVLDLADVSAAIIVMTRSAKQILERDYGVSADKINVIAHGTHLVQHLDKPLLKYNYGFTGRKILSTFGLISSGKSIETTLKALPAIIKLNPTVLFLVIGKTHPSVIKEEAEKYREMLEKMVFELGINNHVQFINYYLPLEDLLEYLQLTDIYLFTSKDPNQAVSGTFSYAISCGCPIISTPMPHAQEVLSESEGVFIDFENSNQLADVVNHLLSDEKCRMDLTLSGLQRMSSTAWENTSLAHAKVFEKHSDARIELQYKLPKVNLEHIKNLTTDFGMIQFSIINQPDLSSGYTLDDNARALIAMCMNYKANGNKSDLVLISNYLHFIEYCMLPNGRLLNYVDKAKQFTKQNDSCNLDDANGRAIWALGFLVGIESIIPQTLVMKATRLMERSLKHIEEIHSTRSIAFAIKGIYYYNKTKPSIENVKLTEKLADRLERMFAHESESEWQWFESYLTYGNSILPEAMLCAYLTTDRDDYKKIAKHSFDFLLSNTFTGTQIKLISNKSWLQKGSFSEEFGEQPIDVAYTILALAKFYNVFKEETYSKNMKIAFNWFLGNNHLHQIIYNPCTGGCYDGLEDTHVNLNQGAESTVSYLMARLCVEEHLNSAYIAKLKKKYIPTNINQQASSSIGVM